MAITREELEADLLASWDPARLAVYGDLLQSEGDPRGELIAIDLAGALTPERDVRRSELLTALVGGAALSWLHRHLRFKLELGFVDLKLGEVGKQTGLLTGALGRAGLALVRVHDPAVEPLRVHAGLAVDRLDPADLALAIGAVRDLLDRAHVAAMEHGVGRQVRAHDATAGDSS